jgi:hypothetical protein
VKRAEYTMTVECADDAAAQEIAAAIESAGSILALGLAGTGPHIGDEAGAQLESGRVKVEMRLR